MKYLVMEARLGHAVVLDASGRLLTVANMGYVVGQTVEWIVPMVSGQLCEKTRPRRIRLWGLSLVILLGGICWGLFYFMQQPHATVYLSADGIFSIQVDRRALVQRIVPLDDDAEDILKGYVYKGKQVEMVVPDLVARVVEEEELENGDHVTIELDAQDENWARETAETLLLSIRQRLSGRVYLSIEARSYRDGKIYAQTQLPDVQDDDDDDDDD